MPLPLLLLPAGPLRVLQKTDEKESLDPEVLSSFDVAEQVGGWEGGGERW